MSLIVQIYAQCDVCQETFPDVWFNRKSPVRKAMKADGWIRRKGQDICPTCQDKEKDQ